MVRSATSDSSIILSDPDKSHDDPMLIQGDPVLIHRRQTKSAEKLVARIFNAKPKPVKYPKGAFFCLASEFAERFSFYGMRSVLTIYMKNVHMMEDHDAKLVYHAFVTLAYFTPLFGSILADGFLGRYRVILYISILYVLGHVTLTLSVIPDLQVHTVKIFDFVGLFVIAFGTGGIKPCVSSFAGDQFPPNSVLERKKFSSFFYFSITLGALLSEVLTPRLSSIHCFGQEYCYALAFGCSAIFVTLGLFALIFGKPFYKIVVIAENSLIQVAKCACYALRNYKRKRPKGASWLDVAKEKYDENLVDDVKSLCHIFLLFIPAIMFWALFDQQGSTWVLQANKMDGHFGHITFLPSQISFLNPFFVIILVPIFVLVLYPYLWPRNILLRPLRRMAYGCMFAVLSFVVAGVVQMYINKSMIIMPEGDLVRYVFVDMDNVSDWTVTSNDSSFDIVQVPHNIDSTGISAIDLPRSIEIYSNTACCNSAKKIETSGPERGRVVVVWSDDDHFSYLAFNLTKPIKGACLFHVIFHPVIVKVYNVSVQLNQVGDIPEMPLTASPSHTSVLVTPTFIGSSRYSISLILCPPDQDCGTVNLLSSVYLQSGGVYCLVIDKNLEFRTATIIDSNNVSIAWMVPQYFLITVGEILFAISGSEFSYGQAAPSMKSTLLACWLMSVAMGNVIDMIISGTTLFQDPALEFFVYAGLMVLFTLYFIYLAARYKYIERDKIEEAKLEAKRLKEQDEEQRKHEELERQRTVEFIEKIIQEAKAADKSKKRHERKRERSVKGLFQDLFD